MAAAYEDGREATGAVPDAIAVNFKEPAVGPAGRAIDIRVRADLSRLQS